LEKLGEEVEKGDAQGLVNEEEGGGANSQAATAILRGLAGPSNTVTVEHGESVPEQEVSIARGSNGPVIGLEKLGGEVDKGVPQGLVNEGGGSRGSFQVNEPALSHALHGKGVQKDTWEGGEGGTGDNGDGGFRGKGFGSARGKVGPAFSQAGSGPLTSDVDNGDEGDREVVREDGEGEGERFEEGEERGSEMGVFGEEGREEEEDGMPHECGGELHVERCSQLGAVGERWYECEAFLPHCGNFVCLRCVIVDWDPAEAANTKEGTGSKQFPEHVFSGQVWEVEEKE
jgi:hypothetical protein